MDRSGGGQGIYAWLLHNSLLSSTMRRCAVEFLLGTTGPHATVMGRPDEVALLVREGMTPKEIADKLEVALSSVESYLHRAVGEGLVRRSDIYLSVSEQKRKCDSTLQKWYDPSHAVGDMYQDLRQIEIALHTKIREALIREYGADELGWWRQGIPEKVRVKCQDRRERDVDDPCEPILYTDLLDLDTILQDQWSLLKDLLPQYTPDRRKLSEHLRRLNRIRNRVMHPVRGYVPEESDFDFVRHWVRTLSVHE